MRRLTGVLVLIAIPWIGIAQTNAEEAVRKVLVDQVIAWNSGDIQGYMKGYWNSPQTMFVSGGSVIRGYQNVLDRYRKNYGSREKMGTLEFGDLAVHLLSDDAAVATGRWELQREADRPWGRFTLILNKKPEGWRIIYDHTSSGE